MKTCLLILTIAIGFVSSSLYANDAQALRIASVGGSVTEIIYRLGKKDNIVGVDSTSVYPVEAKKNHPSLGYVRNLSAEGTLSLTPTLLIGEADAGPPQVIRQIRNAGVETVIITEDDTLIAIENKIKTIARLIHAEEQGQTLIHEIATDLKALQYAQARMTTSPRVLFLLSLSNGSPIAAGSDTSAHTAITEAGGTNVASQFTRWQKLSPEAAFGLNPDVIVVMNRGTQDVLDQLQKLPHFKTSHAMKNQHVYTIDGSYLLGFGPRTPQAIVELGTMIHDHFPLPEGYTFRYDNQAGKQTSGHSH